MILIIANINSNENIVNVNWLLQQLFSLNINNNSPIHKYKLQLKNVIKFN